MDLGSRRPFLTFFNMCFSTFLREYYIDLDERKSGVSGYLCLRLFVVDPNIKIWILWISVFCLILDGFD